MEHQSERRCVYVDGRGSSLRLSPAEWQRVEAYRTQHGLQSVSEAVRRLEAMGRRAGIVPWTPRSRQDAVRAALLDLREREAR